MISQGFAPGPGGDGDQDSALLLETASRLLDDLGSKKLDWELPQDLVEALSCRSELQAALRDMGTLEKEMAEQKTQLDAVCPDS